MSEPGESSRQVIGSDSVLAHAPGVLERRTAASLIVLGETAPIVLRTTAVSIWDAFAAPTSVADVARALAREYGTDEAAVYADVLNAVEHLFAERLLTRSEAGARADA